VGKKWEFPVAELDEGLLWGTVEETRGSKRVLAFRSASRLAGLYVSSGRS
jgi:hypothetical protein